MRMRIIISDMDVRTEMNSIQTRLKDAGHTVADLLRRAGVNRSQWERWKTGQDPRLQTWSRVVDAADQMAPQVEDAA